MIYQSDAITLRRHDNDVLEMQFDLQGESVNKFNQLTVQSLKEVLDAVEKESGVRGLMVTSGKPVFIVGADITEFTSLFGAAADDIAGFTARKQQEPQSFAKPALPHHRRH
jgi:3-hydroxyacyl-CoA dehydrogenase/enoyl-CoA hydratase/3-hydroxybutyryl-CoA epimerase/enoyl-CoA isomerase